MDTPPPVQLLPKKVFYQLIVRRLFAALILLIASLLAGMWGYTHFEQMNIVDSFANASMILAGMGPLDPLHTQQGKIFAGIYALYSGVTFLVLIAVVLSPVLHRLTHQLHLDAASTSKPKDSKLN